MMDRWLQRVGSLHNRRCVSQILNMYIDIDFVYIHWLYIYTCVYTDYVYVHILYLYVIYHLWSVKAGQFENPQSQLPHTPVQQHLKDWNASSPNWGDANQMRLGWWFCSCNWLGLLLPSWELTYPPLKALQSTSQQYILMHRILRYQFIVPAWPVQKFGLHR